MCRHTWWGPDDVASVHGQLCLQGPVSNHLPLRHTQHARARLLCAGSAAGLGFDTHDSTRSFGARTLDDENAMSACYVAVSVCQSSDQHLCRIRVLMVDSTRCCGAQVSGSCTPWCGPVSVPCSCGGSWRSSSGTAHSASSRLLPFFNAESLASIAGCERLKADAS